MVDDFILRRTPAPHALRIGVRRAELPRAGEVAGFCFEDAADVQEGEGWLKLAWPGVLDSLLVVLDEGRGPGRMGFDHAVIVESGRSMLCFLGAYFVARRCGGIVQARHRSEMLPAAAFAERYLEGEELERRWSRAVTS